MFAALPLLRNGSNPCDPLSAEAFPPLSAITFVPFSFSFSLSFLVDRFGKSAQVLRFLFPPFSLP